MAEFFKKNRHMLGFSGKIRSLTTAVHEYVTNALDACEEHGILPDIFVKIEKLGEDRYRLTVRDNGPGLPPDIAARAVGELLSGTKFHRMAQTRGQQGIGAAGVTIFAQITTGKPVHIKTSTGDGKIYEMDVMIDIEHNRPIVRNKVSYSGEWRGFEISAELGEVTYNRGKYSPYEYLRRTVIANPHASITLVEPSGEKTVFPRTSNRLPKIPQSIKPHPAGLNVDDLISLARRTKARKISSMLKNELSSVGDKLISDLREFIKREKPGFDLDKSPKDLTWDEAEVIVRFFRQARFRAPPMNILSPIGKEQIQRAMKVILKPEFLSVVERKPRVFRGGIPFQVEVGIAVGGQETEIMRFANRTPLLFDAGACAITKAVNSIDWKRYGVDLDTMPVVVMVNVSSVFIPYTSTGKQAIADVPEIYNEIRQAIMEAARKLGEYTSKIRRMREALQKRKILEKYTVEVARALAVVLEVPQEKLVSELKSLVERRFGNEAPAAVAE